MLNAAVVKIVTVKASKFLTEPQLRASLPLILKDLQEEDRLLPKQLPTLVEAR